MVEISLVSCGVLFEVGDRELFCVVVCFFLVGFGCVGVGEDEEKAE